MKKYEYKTEKLKFNWTFGFDYLIETKEYIEFLNKHGKEGWLEHETNAHAVKSNGDIHVVVMFRREIQEANNQQDEKLNKCFEDYYRNNKRIEHEKLIERIVPQPNYLQPQTTEDNG